MSVDDVVLQSVDRLHGIVAGDHHEVGGVKVDRNAAGAERVEEVFQHDSGLRTGLNSKVSIQRVGVLGKGVAGLLHDLVAVVGGIGGNYADVGGDHVGAQLLCQLQDTLGFFDESWI